MRPCSIQPFTPSTPMRHQRPVHSATSTRTPGSISATMRAPASALSRTGVRPFFSQGETRAVRLPESSVFCTQPSAPSESRTRYQMSNSWVISTGTPALTKVQAMSWSRLGPWRMLTGADLVETKRGNGRPEGPTCCWAAAGRGARRAARTRAVGNGRRRIDLPLAARAVASGSCLTRLRPAATDHDER